MNFGEKVRYFRLKKNMTQKELAGDFITRNMLSRIETGDASPSLATIEYLTKQLSLPKGFLLSDTLDVVAYERQEFLSEMKMLLVQKQYSACMKKIEESKLTGDDELDFIRFTACFRLALHHYHQAQYLEARRLFSLLSEAAKNFYFSDSDLRAANLYLSVINSLLARGIPTCTPVGDPHLDEYLYVSALQLFNIADITEISYGDPVSRAASTEKARLIAELPILQEPLYAAHIRAKCEIIYENIEDAVMILEKLRIEAKEQDNRLLLYGICSDLEYCYKRRGDYRGAYEMAAEKNIILRPVT